MKKSIVIYYNYILAVIFLFVDVLSLSHTIVKPKYTNVKFETVFEIVFLYVSVKQAASFQGIYLYVLYM